MLYCSMPQDLYFIIFKSLVHGHAMNDYIANFSVQLPVDDLYFLMKSLLKIDRSIYQEDDDNERSSTPKKCCA